MRLLSLNLWGGRQGTLLFDYLRHQAEITDIFCFQEVLYSDDPYRTHPETRGRIHLWQELKDLLSDFTGFYIATSKNHDLEGSVDFQLSFGSALFFKKKIQTGLHQAYPIQGHQDDKVDEDFIVFPRSLQHMEINKNNALINIFNYHGISMPGDKRDTTDRLNQSLKILKILNALKTPFILAGDFNLMPDTQSIQMLDEHYENLIKTYKIDNTRNTLAWNAFGNKQHFADYIFISPEIKVKDFKVPYIEVSDHLPMILDFE